MAETFLGSPGEDVSKIKAFWLSFRSEKATNYMDEHSTFVFASYLRLLYFLMSIVRSRERVVFGLELRTELNLKVPMK